jgi:hypothetical protein
MKKNRKSAPSLRVAATELWRSLSASFFDPYRPELHYMRGPGPKWREKHRVTASPASPAALDLLARGATRGAGAR